MRTAAVPLLALLAVPAFSQTSRYGNKLSPYVATPTKIVDLMLELARVKPGETLYDLGSGDGRIVIAAASKYQAKAIGIEISPKLVAAATAQINAAGLGERARVVEGDVFQTDLTGADVVTMYLDTQSNERLRPRLEKFLKNGARVVSHDYAIHGWKPTHVERVEGRQEHVVYLYELPVSKQ